MNTKRSGDGRWLDKLSLIIIWPEEGLGQPSLGDSFCLSVIILWLDSPLLSFASWFSISKHGRILHTPTFYTVGTRYIYENRYAKCIWPSRYDVRMVETLRNRYNSCWFCNLKYNLCIECQISNLLLLSESNLQSCPSMEDWVGFDFIVYKGELRGWMTGEDRERLHSVTLDNDFWDLKDFKYLGRRSTE